MDGYLYMAYDYPVLGAFLTFLWFFLWVVWLILLFKVINDVFRDHELSGWGKASWLVFVVVLPYLGVLVYLVARGKGMSEREMRRAKTEREVFDAYIRETAGTGAGTGGATAGAAGVDQLARLSELKAKGDLTENEYQRAKEKILA
ncbi:SHOCT domain-containing protein [Streptomyces sp. S1A]|uniref:SHOCT domain-containing protein n=1 Tax=Streptomyces sp. ICN903 TaxID=2964654 RepID=UPI001EDAAFE1|nr:SHOCT domain-containing protein [Streptomyces sp. ICN903]MCG3043169.1 SHOCT domain-containing protein [Streptomyces sp. ICN903]